jgi:protein-disulfide isomerase
MTQNTPEPTDSDRDTGAAADGGAVESDSSQTARQSSRVTMPVAVPVTVALVLGLTIGLIGGWLLPRPGDGSGDVAAATVNVQPGATTDTSAGSQPATVLNPVAPTPVDGGPDGTRELAGLVLGTEGPLVEVFEDYVCPFCARFELSSGAQLREAALGGELRLVVHPIAFLTEDSPRAANASACVYQHEDTDTWVAFHEGVYERQDPSEAAGQYTNEVLLGIAEEVGASAESASCIEGGDYLEWVAAITEQAFQRGVRGTPTVAIDGTVTDVSSFVQ